METDQLFLALFAVIIPPRYTTQIEKQLRLIWEERLCKLLYLILEILSCHQNIFIIPNQIANDHFTELLGKLGGPPASGLAPIT